LNLLNATHIIAFINNILPKAKSVTELKRAQLWLSDCLYVKDWSHNEVCGRKRLYR